MRRKKRVPLATPERKNQQTKKNTNFHYYVTSFIVLLAISAGALWYMYPPLQTNAEGVPTITVSAVENRVGKRVVIHLDTMTLELLDGTSREAVLPLITQGKPGSYFETIGGSYTSDYKVPLHFSSIGHVYMPYSVHIFGNYFIHGIPYYPNGTPVSSAYSGGCIRLSNENAKRVYDFVSTSTIIVITRDSESSFTPTLLSSSTLSSITMTNLMVASISLEALTQDDRIQGIEGEITTRKTILPRLLMDGNPNIAHLYAKSIGVENFVNLMNQKAESLGLTNTHFTDVTSPVETTYEDYDRFMKYIATYKSYLLTIQNVESGK